MTIPLMLVGIVFHLTTKHKRVTHNRSHHNNDSELKLRGNVFENHGRMKEQ